ncbi:MAG: hypothetical protein GX851_06265 [Clostridiales bacterium]|nr:hypothetical protein [Clostridiales bacterium]
MRFFKAIRHCQQIQIGNCNILSCLKIGKY